MLSDMRTIIDLPDEHVAALDELCRRERISRAEAIRRAVARYLEECAIADADDAFGMWRHRAIDALAYEDELRGAREPRTRRAGRRTG